MGAVNNSFLCFSTDGALQLNTVYVMISPQVPESEKGSWESFTLAFNLTQVLHMFCLFRIAWEFMGEVILWDFNTFQNGSALGKNVMGTMQGTMGIEGKKIWEVLICKVFHLVSTGLKGNVASIVVLQFLFLSCWNNFPSSMNWQNFNRFKVRELCADLWSLWKFLLMGRYVPGNNQYFSLLSQVHRAHPKD